MKAAVKFVLEICQKGIKIFKDPFLLYFTLSLSGKLDFYQIRNQNAKLNNILYFYGFG